MKWIADEILNKVLTPNTDPVMLKKNDLFTYRYAYNVCLWRVHKVLPDGVWAHSLKWCKSSSTFISFEQLSIHSSYQYYGRMSWFRSIFLL